MIILAIDTSTKIGTVAVATETALLAEVTADVRAKHGETLLVLVDEAMRHARVTAAELGLIACGLGPGSFTGLRVGLATAKGLAIARATPIVGIPSLRVLARARTTSLRTIVPVTDAHKGEVYAAIYTSEPDGTLIERLAPFHAEPEQAGAHVRTAIGPGEPVWLCGDGVRAYGTRFLDALGTPSMQGSPLHDIPRASWLAAEAWDHFRAHGPGDLQTLEPLYIRPSDAKLPIAEPPR